MREQLTVYRTLENHAKGNSGQQQELQAQQGSQSSLRQGIVPEAESILKGILKELDEQALLRCLAEAEILRNQGYSSTRSDAAPEGIHEIRAPDRIEQWTSNEPRGGLGLWLVFVASALVVALGGTLLHWFADRLDELTGRAAVDVVVERIISVESNGDPNAKNKRSSATGLGQFLNGTWLDMIRAYRPDLANGRSEMEILELRREPKLAREITLRFAERNAALLRERGLPVTAGTIYLAHFAGPAGAVAILSAPESADAALIMANADASGRTKRQHVIKANPFLERFSVADLKIWADRKMRAPAPHSSLGAISRVWSQVNIKRAVAWRD
jgi:hypothetical protein